MVMAWGFTNLPHREAFGPTRHIGPRMGCDFRRRAEAVEVRSENDMAGLPEKMQEKRRPLCVRDAGCVGRLAQSDVIKVYRASDPDHPTIYRHGDIAEAEPAVPGWRMAVDDLFG